MKGKSLKIFAVCCVLVLALSPLAGCGSASLAATATLAATSAAPAAASATPAPAATVAAQNYWDMLGSAKDSSDLPTWTGKQLKLTLWYSQGVGGQTHLKATNDVVQAEIKRITGVEIDTENSYDNGGNPLQTKLDMLAAANDWPNLVEVGGDEVALKDLVLYNKLYDLTDLIPQDCPDIANIFFTQQGGKLAAKNASIQSRLTAGGLTGKYYFLPSQATTNLVKSMSVAAGNFDAKKWFYIEPPQPEQNWVRIWVRDDILKAMYPSAMTQDEIEAAYMQAGSFTADQILTPAINTPDDFWKFCYDMKAAIAKNGFKDTSGKPVEVTYAAYGTDNWELMAVLMPWVYGYGICSSTNYTDVYDRLAGAMQWSYDKPYFKTAMQASAKAVRDGVMAPESLIDTSQIFSDKVNSGHYAMTYAWTQPDPTALKKAGASYRYRYLWVNVPVNYNEFPDIGDAENTNIQMGIFKDTVKEEDLPQILHYLNFCESNIGDKLYNWGPRSAGLFTEDANGNRTFTDKDLEANMVYGVDNSKNVYYGLYNIATSNRCPWPQPFVWADASMNSPKYTYNDRTKNAGDANLYFNPGVLPGLSRNDHIIQAALGPYEWNFPDLNDVFQKGRDAFEKSITKVLTAKNDAEFETLFANMVATGQSIGLNDDLIAKVDKTFKDANKDSMDTINAPPK